MKATECIDAARRFAEVLEIPAFLVDTEGGLLFYNKQAARVLGRSFEETGPMPASVWGRLFIPTDESGSPLTPDSLPLMVTIAEKRPATGSLWIRGIDNRRRQIAVTSIPLCDEADGLLGAMAIFWTTREQSGE
jgi:PAS domain-containing protein